MKPHNLHFLKCPASFLIIPASSVFPQPPSYCTVCCWTAWVCPPGMAGMMIPDGIFVKKVSVYEDTEISNMAEPNSAAPVSEVDFSDVQKSEIPTSRGRKNQLLEVSKTDPNKTNKNQTEFIQINLSIPSHRLLGPEGIARYEHKEANIEFLRRAICAPLLCWTSPGRTSLSENQPPGQGPKPAPFAAQSQQVCHLVAQMTLVGGIPPNRSTNI